MVFRKNSIRLAEFMKSGPALLAATSEVQRRAACAKGIDFI
jgi:hypothetical protein